MVEERNFKREKLPRKYTAKITYKYNDNKFKRVFLKKLERNW